MIVVSQIEEVFPKLTGTKFDEIKIEDKWMTHFKNKNLFRKLVSALKKTENTENEKRIS
jgi:frataxin-like iron-binding protein CyaY